MEGHAELLALQKLDESSTQLQRQGNYLEALQCMERALILRQHFFGPESEEVWSACKVVGEMCNLLSMTFLQQENFGMALELLKKAEVLTARDAKGRAVTFNNYACLFRRQGKLHAALKYLQQAIRIESSLDKVPNAADTFLNTCAVLSQLGRHQAALEHAQQALIFLQEEIFSSLGQSGQPTAPRTDRVAVLAIAHHNLAVEQEFLKRSEQALQSYRKSVETAERYLGPSHAITITVRNSLMAFKRVQSLKSDKHGGKRGDSKDDDDDAAEDEGKQGRERTQTTTKSIKETTGHDDNVNDV